MRKPQFEFVNESETVSLAHGGFLLFIQKHTRWNLKSSVFFLISFKTNQKATWMANSSKFGQKLAGQFKNFEISHSTCFCIILFIISKFAIRLGTTYYQVMHLSPWMISDGQKNFGTMPICTKEKLLSSDKMFSKRFSKNF